MAISYPSHSKYQLEHQLIHIVQHISPITDPAKHHENESNAQIRPNAMAQTPTKESCVNGKAPNFPPRGNLKTATLTLFRPPRSETASVYGGRCSRHFQAWSVYDGPSFSWPWAVAARPPESFEDAAARLP